MSWKSIVYSIFAILSGGALLFLDVILFGFNAILGIIGIILLLVVPGALLNKAKNKADGVLDRILAKYIAPALIIVVGFFTLMYILVWMG